MLKFCLRFQLFEKKLEYILAFFCRERNNIKHKTYWLEKRQRQKIGIAKILYKTRLFQYHITYRAKTKGEQCTTCRT